MKNPRKGISSIILDPRNSRIMESISMFEILFEEMAFLEKELKATPKDYRLRRIYVRSLFAFVESSVYRMKQDAMEFKKDFSPEEILLLKETRPTLDDSGCIRRANDHIKTLPNLRFAFGAYAKALEIDFKLDVSDHGWGAFKEALKIRHCLTHPKQLLDLIITAADWKIIRDSAGWFLNQLNEMKKVIDSKFGAGRNSSI